MIGTHRAGRERESRAGDGAAQVVVGGAVAAGKVGAGEAENFPHLGRCPTLAQQVSCDPAINNAPVGLGKALADVPSLHASLIEFGGNRRGNGCGDRIVQSCGGVEGERGGRRRQGAGRLQQGFGLRRHTHPRAYDFDPGGVAADVRHASFWLVKPASRPRWRQSVLAGSPP